jgi:uncharacterized protein
MQCGRIGEKEIDFVCDRDGKRVYIQIAYLLASPEVIEREYAGLDQIRDQRPKYVISMDSLQFQAKNGILHIQAWNMSQIFF